MTKEYYKQASEITPDEHNPNEGTERGDYLLEESLTKYGAGRSGLIDKNGKIIAGNHTFQKVAEMGLPIRVIPTDGKEWVVVQRTDLDMDTDVKARELGIADNFVAEKSLQWSAETLAELSEAGVELDSFWRPGELEKLGVALEKEEKESGDGLTTSEDEEEKETDDKKIKKLRTLIEKCQNSVHFMLPEEVAVLSQELAILLNTVERILQQP